MQHYLDILKKYWGYDKFRALQSEIIESIGCGYDTLALLPTGGGKSICFQVPALAMPGVCLVISPLVALMQDQVFQLQKRGISAKMLHAAMNRREIDYTLSNAQHQAIKFLYVSPERLQTELFREYIKYIPIGLLAIDEAHCVSQWGYDFRPPYLAIGDFRDEFLPKVPCVALTATATPAVREDIQQKLHFRASAKVFQKSFARDNLSYSTLYEEDKNGRLLKMLHKIQGTAVVYVRNRKRTQETAEFLQKNGISADFYHAGLDANTRDKKQTAWIQNQTRVIVATNAFGMGIDKPDVRLVVHLDLPDTLEAYYQEAGRAGRDEKKAFAVALYTKQDTEQVVAQTEKNSPTIAEIKQVYHTLCNHFKIAVGSGEMASFDFDLEAFSNLYKFSPITVFQALQKLEENGLVQLSESFGRLSQVHIPINQSDLYAFQVKYASYDLIIKALLRLYGGELFTHFINISEEELAKKANISETDLVAKLQYLQQAGILIYQAKKEKPQVVLLQPRYPTDELPISVKILEARRNLLINKAKSVANYVTNTTQCRTLALLEYFGELSEKPCGICDVCVHQKRNQIPAQDLAVKIREILRKESKIPMSEFGNLFTGITETKIHEAIRILTTNGEAHIVGLSLVIK